MQTYNDLLNAKVTIYFSGLMLLCFDKRGMCQAGIHTKAEGHDLKLRIGIRGQAIPLWPPLNPNGTIPTFSHRWVKQNAPLWLYIGASANADTPDEGTVNGYAKDDLEHPNSFAHTLDFEGKNFYPQGIELKSGVLAPLNIPVGTFYTVSRRKARRKQDRKSLGIIATTVAAAIGTMSTNEAAATEFLILRSEQSPCPLYSAQLEPGAQYEVIINNTPISTGSSHSRHHHFIQYYEAFDPPGKEPRYTIEPDNGGWAPPDFECLSGFAGETAGLPAWTADESQADNASTQPEPHDHD